MLGRRGLILWWALAGAAWVVQGWMVAASLSDTDFVRFELGIAITVTVWAMLCTIAAEWRRRESQYLKIVLNATVASLVNSGVLYRTRPDDDLARLEAFLKLADPDGRNFDPMPSDRGA